MSIDIHCHVIGGGLDINNVENDVFFNMDDNQHVVTWAVSHIVSNGLSGLGAKIKNNRIETDDYFKILVRLLSKSKLINKIVLLALDAVYENGNVKQEETDLFIGNRYLSRKVKALNKAFEAAGSTKRFFYGASVSPNRSETEWQEALDFVKNDADAVLMKWIPSTQHIDINSVSDEFWAALKDSGLPLLCHVGPEYSFPQGIRRKELDMVGFLEIPLKYGINVIAAHCAAPVFPIVDKNQMQRLAEMMATHNTNGKVKLWADTSALSLSTRISYIPEILEKFKPEWLVHGSDFPIPIDGTPHLPLVTHDITPKEYLDIVATKNPFDRDVKIKKAHGFDPAILGNAEKVLRMP